MMYNVSHVLEGMLDIINELVLSEKFQQYVSFPNSIEHLTPNIASLCAPPPTSHSWLLMVDMSSKI